MTSFPGKPTFSLTTAYVDNAIAVAFSNFMNSIDGGEAQLNVADFGNAGTSTTNNLDFGGA